MAAGACINHPGVEAVGRCKQCGKPFCNACKTQGPTGYFCSPDCKQKHETFVQRAQQFDDKKGKFGAAHAFRKVVRWVLIILIAAAAIAVAGTLFDIPIVSDIVRNALGRVRG